jgi:hypothetical protein
MLAYNSDNIMFIYNLFNDSVGSSAYIVFRIFMNNELERMWKEAVMA